MNEQLYTPKQLSQLLGVSSQTLTQWEKQKQIKAIKTKGGHRRYFFNKLDQENNNTKQSVIYARVSSSKQKMDLQRQIASIKAIYPDYEVIQDIGSGINFKRRGLISLLERVISGHISKIVVAHKDRLCRFGIELFRFLFKRFEVSFEVLSDLDIKDPTTELATDLLSIITVYTARYYGARKYNILQKNKNLSKRKTDSTIQQVPWSNKVLFQQSKQHIKRKRSSRTIKIAKPKTFSNAK